jgi:chromosome segregation ATPase
MSPSSSKQAGQNGVRKNNKNNKGGESEVDASPPGGEERPAISQQTRPSISQEDLANLQDAFGPCVEKLGEAKANIMQSAQGIDELMEHIANSFKGKLHIVKEVGNTWGQENQKDEEIRLLKERVEFLMNWAENKAKPLKDELHLERQKYDVLLSEKEALRENYEMRYKDREIKLREREKKLEEEKATQKSDFVAQQEKLTRSLDKKLKRTTTELAEKYSSLENDHVVLQRDHKSLSSDFEKSDRAYESLNNECAKLKTQIKVYQTEFGAPEEPEEHL